MKTISPLFRKLAFVAGFAGFLAINLAAVPASAQTRAALTQNVDEKGRVPFQQTFNPSCNAQFACLATFTVPAGQRLVITHVNVLLGNATAASSIIGVLRADSALPSSFRAVASPIMYLPVTRVSGAANGGAFFILDAELTMFADGNTLVYMGFQTVDSSLISVGGAFVATVTGYLVPLS